MRLESKEILCWHILRVLVLQHQKSIPEAYIYKRWSREACELSQKQSCSLNIPLKLIQRARFRMLTSLCQSMCYYASNEEGCRHIVPLIEQEAERLNSLWLQKCGVTGSCKPNALSSGTAIGDPAKCRHKGDKPVVQLSSKQEKLVKYSICS